MENTILENKLDEVKNIISELPHFTSDDTDKIIREINFIASGSRNRYVEQEQLESQLKTWGREFGKVLKEKYNIHNKNTNYSSWVYGNYLFSIDIFYVLSRLKDHVKIDSEEDFCVTITSWKTGNHVVLGTTKTTEEAIQILIENDLYQK
jgi:hypothetical protein